ncbi:MAG: hypothetical protein ACJA0N_000436 [Pseudohongiellaceae bacterium]|jgi:hypothetical protein
MAELGSATAAQSADLTANCSSGNFCHLLSQAVNKMTDVITMALKADFIVLSLRGAGY